MKKVNLLKKICDAQKILNPNKKCEHKLVNTKYERTCFNGLKTAANSFGNRVESNTKKTYYYECTHCKDIKEINK